MRLLRHWGSEWQVMLGPRPAGYMRPSSTPDKQNAVQRTTLQAKKHMTASGGPAGERLQGGHASRPSRRASLYRVALRCRPPRVSGQPLARS